jgi:hypothetical protein
MSNRLKKRIAEYAFRAGMKFPIDPNVAGKELERINHANNGVTPQAVVDEARPEEAPLHPVFEWDDERAGENWRRYQARNLIRAVITIEPSSDGKESTTQQPAYVHVEQRLDDGQKRKTYMPIRTVVNRPDLFADALSHLQRKASEMQSAVEALERAARKFNQSDEILAKVTVMIKALETASRLANSIGGKAH